MPVTYYIHPPGCSYKWPLPHWMSTPSYSPSSREKTKHHSLRMHITCQLCQAGRTCTCPLSTREGEQAAPNHEMLWCLGAGKCITYIEAKWLQQAMHTLGGLVHPHSDAWATSMSSRTFIYVSSCHLGGWTGCNYEMPCCLGAVSASHTLK